MEEIKILNQVNETVQLKRRVCVIGIIVKGDRTVSVEIQKILNQFSENIIGRMGVPDRSRGISIISVAFEGTPEEVSSFTGKLGRLDNVNVKSAMTSVET